MPPGHFFGGGDATWSQNKAGSGKLPEVSKVNNPKIELKYPKLRQIFVDIHIFLFESPL